jgi:hypothetical protein
LPHPWKERSHLGQARQCGLAQSWLTGPALGDSATARNDLHDGFLVGPRHPDTSSCPYRQAIGAEVEARIDGQCHIPTQHEVRLFDIERPNEAGVESGSTSSSNRLRKASRALRVRVGLSCVLAQDVSAPSLLSSESSSGASSSNPTGFTFQRQTGAITPVSRSEGRSEVPGGRCAGGGLARRYLMRRLDPLCRYGNGRMLRMRCGPVDCVRLCAHRASNVPIWHTWSTVPCASGVLDCYTWHSGGGLALNRSVHRLDSVSRSLSPEDGIGSVVEVVEHHSTSAYCVPSAYHVLNSSYFGISSEFAFGSMQT